MSEFSKNDGFVCRDTASEQEAEGAYATIGESVRVYDHTTETLNQVTIDEALFGSREEIEKARETLRQSLTHHLQKVSEEFIVRGQEQGHLSEHAANVALKHKRLMELDAQRHEWANELAQEGHSLDGEER